MNDSPSTHGPNGKDERGRFQRGNKLGKGNPMAGRAAKIRAVLLQKLTPKATGEIADKLIAEGKAGDIAAIKEIFDRTIGRPVTPVEFDGQVAITAIQFEFTHTMPNMPAPSANPSDD